MSRESLALSPSGGPVVVSLSALAVRLGPGARSSLLPATYLDPRDGYVAIKLFGFSHTGVCGLGGVEVRVVCWGLRWGYLMSRSSSRSGSTSPAMSVASLGGRPAPSARVMSRLARNM